MGNVFSYLDTALRIIHLNIILKDNDDELKKIAKVLEEDFKKSQDTRRYVIENFNKTQINSNPEVQFLLEHESHHFWQTIFYPCLYLFSWLEYRTVFDAYQNIHDDEYPDGERFIFGTTKIGGSGYNNLRYRSFRFKIEYEGGKFFWNKDKIDEDLLEENVFSLNDIIEDSTTLFQYKCGDNDQTPAALFEWIRNPRNRGYKRLIKFLGQKINQDFVYKLLLPIAQLSFYTTEPISAFINILNYANYLGLEVIDDSAVIYNYIKKFLLDNYPVVKIDFKRMNSITDTPVCFIDNECYLNIIESSASYFFPYPIHKLALKLFKEIKKNPQFERALCEPNKEKLAKLALDYMPIAVFYNYQNFKARNNAIVISNEMAAEDIETAGGTLTFSYYLFQIMRVKETVIGLLSGNNLESPHNCHHKKCPYYSSNICRKWNAIPEDFRDCEFPIWLKYMFKLEYQPKNMDVVRVKEDNSVYKREHDTLMNKKLAKRKFDYILTESRPNKYIIKIPKEVIEHRDLDFLAQFLKILIEDEGLTYEQLIGSLVLNFPEYMNDPREIFEIDEIKSYLNFLCENLSWFLAILNLNSRKHNQQLVIIPMFVKHERLTSSDHKVSVNLDLEDMEKFVKKYLLSIVLFCKEHELDYVPIIEKLDINFFNQ